MCRMLPRLFFEHVSDTSSIVEEDGELIAFLVGFVSPTHPDEAYIHFVGVAPERRGSGLGRELYLAFFRQAAGRGCPSVSCITGPVNTGSIAFHRSMGFDIVPGDVEVDGVSIHTAYDGPGEDRVVFRCSLP